MRRYIVLQDNLQGISWFADDIILGGILNECISGIQGLMNIDMRRSSCEVVG